MFTYTKVFINLLEFFQFDPTTILFYKSFIYLFILAKNELDQTTSSLGALIYER